MFRILKRLSSRIRPAVLATAAALTLMPAAATAQFLGGGYVYNFTESCGPWWPSSGPAVGAAHFRAAQLILDANDRPTPPSSLSIVLPNGAHHLSIWGPIAQGTAFLGIGGRSLFRDFTFYTSQPQARVLMLNVTRRLNPTLPASLENAYEIVVRLRVQNFDNTPGCSANVAATLQLRDD